MFILSVFPGLDLLGRAFEERGHCVVRGPDVIWGGDVHSFHPPAGKFDFVIGGPPCQTFSPLAHLARARGYEVRFGNLIPEFNRVVAEAAPRGFLMENVPQAPDAVVEGYVVHAQRLNNVWLGEEQNRLRTICFGTRDGRRLHIEYAPLQRPMIVRTVTRSLGGRSRRSEAASGGTIDRSRQGRKPQPVRAVTSGGGGGYAYSQKEVRERVLASNGEKTVTSAHGGDGHVARMARYPIADALRLQGLPEDYLKHAPFTVDGKRRAIANGVPLPMGRALAQAVERALERA